MGSFRTARLGEDIKRELTDIFRMLKDYRIDQMLTIVRLELASDLSFCKVYVSSMQGIEKAEESVKGLVSATGFIKRELGARMQMRRVPELKFIADDSIEYSAYISRKLDELK